jgi:hypothetical protein
MLYSDSSFITADRGNLTNMLEDANNLAASPRARGRGLPALRVDYLWAIIVVAGFSICAALSVSPPNDFWWHLKAGQLVAERGIPSTNLFAWTLPSDHPYVYATWLGEWLFYAIYSLLGLPAVVIVRNLLATAAFALVAVEARRRSGSWRLAALAVLLAGAMSINNLIIRTQNWSWLPFALYVLILGAYAAGQLHARALIALPVLMAFWVNAHGAFVLGLALLAIVCAGETLRRLLRQPQAPGWERLRALYLAAAATLAATLLNPSGVGIFGYVVKLLTDPPSQGLVLEWQPPTTHSIAGFFFFATVIIILFAFALARRRPSLTDLLLVCAFLWLAWGGIRYVVWFGLVATPVLAQALAADRAQAGRPARRPQKSPVNLAIAIAFVALVVAVQPPLISSLPLPDDYREDVADVPGAPTAFTDKTPVAAAEYLRSHPQMGQRLYNEMGYGSYLIWALYPEAQVFVDARVELYPIEQWQDYIAINQGQNVDTLLIDKYGVTRVILDRELQPKLSAALQQDRQRWTLEYQDHQSEIFRRNDL